VVVRANAGQGVTLSTTPGGSVSYVANGCGFDQIASFTASGCLTIADGDPTVYSADYLVVAGGGGGGNGSNSRNGGGGAGGYRASGYGPSPLQGSAEILGVGCYSITVGAGGAASNCGSDSTFSTITSTGGGSGGPATIYGEPGGSGGGGGSGHGCSIPNPANYGLGGTGNTPPVSPPQGNPGGNGGSPDPAGGGGGGGATAAGGTTYPTSGPGLGGAGAPNNITGSCVTYAGGGGGANPGSVRPGGSGGGGAGGNPSTTAGAGIANTGGGGGGAGSGNTGGAAGSGIVIVRFPSAACIAVAPGTNTVTTCVGPANDKVATFTVTGTLTVS